MAARVRGIYVIVDPEATRGRPVIEVARASLEGGARVVQLRDKLRDKGPMLETACELRALCDGFGALFVMNDHADVALVSEAHGLHVGQTDMPVEAARRVLEPHQIVGNSNGTMEEALRSADGGGRLHSGGRDLLDDHNGQVRAQGAWAGDDCAGQGRGEPAGGGYRRDQRDEHRGGRGGGGRLRLRG